VHACLRDVTLALVCLGDSGAVVLCSQLAQHLALHKLASRSAVL